MPNTTPAKRHTALRGWDLATGKPKLRWDLPGDNSVCNDFALGPDKALYITDTANAKIYRLAPGASTPELASDTMKEFVDRYTKMFGEYNDESNTKVYALEYIIETIKANPAAIDNVDEFKKTIDTFEAPNPFMKGDAKLKYVGMTSFGQKRQISVPLVVNEYKGGQFETLFVGQVD